MCRLYPFLEEGEILLFQNIAGNRNVSLAEDEESPGYQTHCHINPDIWGPSTVVERNLQLDVSILFFHLKLHY